VKETPAPLTRAVYGTTSVPIEHSFVKDLKSMLAAQQVRVFPEVLPFTETLFSLLHSAPPSRRSPWLCLSATLHCLSFLLLFWFSKPPCRFRSSGNSGADFLHTLSFLELAFKMVRLSSCFSKYEEQAQLTNPPLGPTSPSPLSRSATGAQQRLVIAALFPR